MSDVPASSPTLSASGRLTGALLLRFLLLTGILGAVALGYGRQLTERLLPVFQNEIEFLDDTFRITSLRLALEGADQVIRLDVGLAHRIALHGRVADPDPRGAAYASTLVGHVTLPAVIFVSVLFAWPATKYVAYAWRGLFLVPVLMLLWMIDVPLILLGMLWQIVFQAMDPGRFSLLVTWSTFLQGGGEFALALSIAALIGRITEPPGSTMSPGVPKTADRLVLPRAVACRR